MARNRVDWGDPRLGASVYEDMVAVLISRLHPEVQRVDGSGGDGGRDVLLPLPSGLEIFELKSFSGRVGRSQRAQIKRSLAKAAAHSPVAWHLVVPIDPTPGEMIWFETLTKDYSFRCDWLGKTWLDGHMADHPELPRYYIEGTSEEVVEALKELHSEQAYLSGGLPDAVQRISRLTDRLNELDPHYIFSCSTDPVQGIRITVLPRYPGAEQDSPISVKARFNFPDTEEGRLAEEQLRESVAYGKPGSVSADFVSEVRVDGISGLTEALTGKLAFGAAELPSGGAPQVGLRVVDDDGNIVTQLPLKVTSRTTGLQGGDVILTDHSGAVHVTMRFDLPSRRFSLQYRYSQPEQDVLPCNLRPAIRFLAEVQAGHSVIVLINNESDSPPVPAPPDTEGDIQAFARLVTDLDDIQRKSGVYFPIPSSLSAQEEEDILVAAHLFRGETVNAEWTSSQITILAKGAKDFIELLRDEVKDFWGNLPYILALNGRDYPLGRQLRTFATAKLESVPDLPDDLPPEKAVVLTLVPGSDATVSMTLASGQVTGTEPGPSAT